jgi:acyl dehydratase
MGIDKCATEIGYRLPQVVKVITADLMCSYSKRYPGIFIETIHTEKEAATSAGFPDMVLQGSQTMNFGAELLFKTYRKDWINDSHFEVKFIKPVLVGETVTVKGEVVDKKEIAADTYDLKIDVWAEDTSGDKVMIGEAVVRVCVPLN